MFTFFYVFVFSKPIHVEFVSVVFVPPFSLSCFPDLLDGFCAGVFFAARPAGVGGSSGVGG